MYKSAIAEQVKFNLMIHNNFTPDGRKTPASPGAVESDHARALPAATQFSRPPSPGLYT